MLKFAAYASLFFFVALYPFGFATAARRKDHLYRALVMAVLVSGLIVAVVGIVEFFTWNGKILWLFVPYDWGAAQTSPLSRALGPFVNFDHFGNYLALVLPLAAGGALFRDDLFSKRERVPGVLCALPAFLALCGSAAERFAWGLDSNCDSADGSYAAVGADAADSAATYFGRSTGHRLSVALA